MSLTFFMSFSVYLNRAPLPAPRPPTYTLGATLKTPKKILLTTSFTHTIRASQFPKRPKPKPKAI